MLEFTGILKPESEVPLYEQLYRSLSAAIQSGELKQNTKMPGKRTFAGQLGVSVNTVDTAYQLLVAEGYLESRPRSGFYVQQVQQPIQTVTPPTVQPPEPTVHWKFDMGTGGIDPSLFPFRAWGRIQRELLYARPQLLLQGKGQGDIELRSVLAAHLRQYRGVTCQPDQIVIGAGIEYLLGLLLPILGNGLAIEDPGYPKVKRLVKNAGMQAIPVPVDEKGISVQTLAQTQAQAVYVTPSHQFPTGVTMPAGRRSALLGWAHEQAGRFIIEDDYDSEFRFDLRPLPSLQGMDKGEKVVYIGTFSKSLAPSIRIACMVLPKPLIQPWKERYSSYASTVSRFEQQTLCEFIRQKHFSRHLSRMRNHYRKRMQQFKAALQNCFGKKIKISGEHTGLHLLLWFEQADEQQLVDAALKNGLRVSGLSQYCSKPQSGNACILVGYGCLAENEIMPAANALQQAWKEFL